MVKQPALSLSGARKGEVRTQIAALCWRLRRGKVQILLITSRRSRRWIVPKGWPMNGKTPAAAAAQEAWEEAGVTGKPGDVALGVYTYGKTIGNATELPCMVMLYPLQVETLAKKYPEKGERRRRWVSRGKAAKLVAEPDLAVLLKNFDPRANPKKS